MGSVILGAVLVLPLLAQTDSANSAGRFQGTVIDPAGAAIRAIVRVLQQPSGAAILRFNATDSGAFQTDPLPAGVYSLTFFSPGFRRRDLTKHCHRGRTHHFAWRDQAGSLRL